MAFRDRDPDVDDLDDLALQFPYSRFCKVARHGSHQDVIRHFRLHDATERGHGRKPRRPRERHAG